jgi:hypothetical protein
MNQAHEVHPLLALVEAVEAVSETDKIGRRRALRDHALIGDRLDAAAIWWREDPAAVDVLLDRLAEAISKDAAKIQRDNIQRRAKEQTAKKGPHLRAVEPDEQEADCGCPWEHARPLGWPVDPSGVYRLTRSPTGETDVVRVTMAPLVMLGRAEDIETGAYHVEIAWRTGERWTREWVPRSVAADARAVVGLAERGAPVSTSTARHVVSYLSAAEACPGLHESATVGRQGWHEGGVFALGETVFAPPDYDGPEVSVASHAAPELFGAVRTTGTREGWAAAWAECSDRPIAAAAVYASAAAPLLKILGVQSFFVDWSDESGRGKTTALRMGASVWGSDRGLIRTWESTPTYLERVAALGCDLPVFLDESTRGHDPRKAAETATVAYKLANETGKGRGTIKGVQQSSTWRSVFLSTGEMRLIDVSQDQGLRGRIVSVTGPPTGLHGAERSDRIKAIVLANHGHLGRDLIRWLVEADHEALRASHRAKVAVYADPEQLPTRYARRLVDYVAAMEVAADILHTHLGLPRPKESPIAEIWRQVQTGSKDADRPAEALRAVWEAVVSRRAAMWGRHQTQGDKDILPAGGWIGAWDHSAPWQWVAVRPAEVDAILTRAGFSRSAVAPAWKARGWIKTGKTGLTYPTTVDGEQVKCFWFLIEGLRKSGAIDEDEF